MDVLVHARLMAVIYADCLRKTLVQIPRYWVVALTLPFYWVCYQAVLFLVKGFNPFLAGIFIGLAIDALVSSFLVMVYAMIQNEKMTLEDFRRSFLTYFFDVMSVLFLLWAFYFFVTPFVQTLAPILFLFIQIALFILLNPLPELIYQGGGQGGGIEHAIDHLRRSFDFIKENWVEWFVPNVLLAIFFFFGLSRLHFDFPFWPIILTALNIYFVYAVMVFRGFLFKELRSSSRRARLFKFRTEGLH